MFSMGLAPMDLKKMVMEMKILKWKLLKWKLLKWKYWNENIEMKIVKNIEWKCGWVLEWC